MNDIPYANATSGEKAMNEITRILRGFGCSKIGSMVDDEKNTLTIQFVYRERTVILEASAKGWAAAWLRKNPYSSRKQCNKADYERRALRQAEVAIYSILRDWIKGQITAVECGIMSFEGAFLGQILLPSGSTVLEHIQRDNLLLLEEQP